MEVNFCQEKTENTNFGSIVKGGHDYKKLYSSKMFNEFQMPENQEFRENSISKMDLNKLYIKSTEVMDEIPDESIHLMILSPPYNVGKEYDNDLTLEEYEKLFGSVFCEIYKKRVSGGMVCINIVNIGRKPYISLHLLVMDLMFVLDFLMRDEIIMDKSVSEGDSALGKLDVRI